MEINQQAPAFKEMAFVIIYGLVSSFFIFFVIWIFFFRASLPRRLGIIEMSRPPHSETYQGKSYLYYAKINDKEFAYDKY